jgi:hypothetical protein
LIFGILCFISLLFISKLVPETKGKSHEDFKESMWDSSSKKEEDKASLSKPLLTDFQ